MVTNTTTFKFDRQGRSVPCSQVQENLDANSVHALCQLKRKLRGYRNGALQSAGHGRSRA